MRFSRFLTAPVRRGALAAILVAVVLFPSSAVSIASKSCGGAGCSLDGHIQWTRQLTGSWIAENGFEGTEYSQGQAYAAVGGGTVAIGFGLTVAAFDAATGQVRWTTELSGVPAGWAIVSVRSWAGVVTVGVAPPALGVTRPGLSDAGKTSTAKSAGAKVSKKAQGKASDRGVGSAGAVGAAGAAGAPGAAGAAGAKASFTAAGREELVLSAATGRQIQAYPSAPYGGAVSSGLRRTVIVGTTSVTSYDNAAGRILWQDRIGPAEQAWRVDGSQLYVTVSANGVLGTAPVTAVREISLRTGAERLIVPRTGSFDGVLNSTADGELYFASAGGLSIYSVESGRLTGRRPGAVPEGIDPVQQVLYVDVAGALIGIDPHTGKNEPGTSVPGPPGTYGVRAGVALGLDPGAAGAAWGYSIARKHVIWTTRSLPWPHYFVDPSGVGGSADEGSDLVLLTTCGKVGQAVAATSLTGAGMTCLRPQLVAIDR